MPSKCLPALCLAQESPSSVKCSWTFPPVSFGITPSSSVHSTVHFQDILCLPFSILACLLPLLPLQTHSTGTSRTQGQPRGCVAATLGHLGPSGRAGDTGQWHPCHIPLGVAPGEGNRGVRSYNTQQKKSFFEPFKLKVAIWFFLFPPSFSSFLLFRGNISFFFFFFSPHKEAYKYFDHI